ncbi:MAG: M56 family metallopeptidase [Acidimicrobiales bacterium]
MSIATLALASSLLCLVVLPECLHSSTRFDANPRAGLVVWVTLCTVGWLSAITLFLEIGLGRFHRALLPTTASFLAHLGDGHPLRGLGLTEVVGLSVAFDITVLLVGGLLVAAWNSWRLRLHQRTVLDLVSARADAAGVSLVDHAHPLAYYLPGGGGRVVVSTGALEVLSRPEYDAVISHEFGHRHGRHGALLIPLQALSPFVSFLPLARRAPTVMRTYLEMAADDFARDRGSSDALRGALEKSPLFHRPPQGSFAMHDGIVERRLRRLGCHSVPVLDEATIVLAVGAASSLFWTLLMLR